MKDDCFLDRAQAGTIQKRDERIFGDGGFVEKVLSQAEEASERKYHLKANGIDIGRIAVGFYLVKVARRKNLPLSSDALL
jgi:hypothetical protein